MNDALLAQFQKELAMLRTSGRAFAERYPQIAGRLHLAGDVSPDPHVERVIEAVALLAARVQCRIDDGVPELTQALLANTYPHLTRPIPTRTILQMEVNLNAADASTGLTIPRGAELVSAPVRHGSGVDQVPCRFVTTCDTTLWPLTLGPVVVEPRATSPVREARVGGQLVLRCPIRGMAEGGLENLAVDRLRFFLDAPPQVRNLLLELLLARLKGVVVGRQPAGRSRPIFTPWPAATVSSTGFAPEEEAYAYDPRTPTGYRYLLEYFTFAEKFMFVDVAGLGGVLQGAETELCFVVDTTGLPKENIQLLMEDNETSLRLGCVPAINLFTLGIEPVRLSHRVPEYHLVTDARRPLAYEIHAVETVELVARQNQVTREPLRPLYSRPAGEDSADLFWHARVVPAPDGGQEIWLSLSDRTGRSLETPNGLLSITARCSNRDLPNRLSSMAFTLLEDPSRIGSARALRKPARALRPGISGQAQWQLVSHLALNRLSLTDGGAEALRGLLSLYNLAMPDKDPVLHREIQQQIDSLVDLEVTASMHAVGTLARSTWCLGSDVTLVFDESDASGSRYPLAMLLERFLALYASANSFTRVRARSLQRNERIAEWTPRIGLRPLL